MCLMGASPIDAEYTTDSPAEADELLELAHARRPGNYLPIFTIPVYLRSRLQYRRENLDQVHRYVEKMYPYGKKSVAEVNKWLEDHPHSADGLLWPYWGFSDIVGYVEFCIPNRAFGGNFTG